MTARVVMCLLAACVVVGCTPDPTNGGDPTSTAPTTTTTASSISMPPLTPLPTSPPPITRPLDASQYATEGTVCDLLTDIQANEFGLPSPGDPFTAGGGSLLTCRRDNPDSVDERDIEYSLWPDYDLWTSEFGSSRRGSDDPFLLDIAGQPAVVNGSDPEPACQVKVGIAARQGFEILAKDDGEQACALAVAVAERMVRNLGG